MIHLFSFSALYFTNCMYASRQCVLLNRIVQKSSDKPSSTLRLSFADLSLQLRIKAYETLNTLCERFSVEVLEVLSTEQAACKVDLPFQTVSIDNISLPRPCGGFRVDQVRSKRALHSDQGPS